jgi:uroporphyrin-III C-methyltransferase
MTVFLVGAGPGDPGLLTLRAHELLARADVVVHDRLVGSGVLELIPTATRRIDVGKSPGTSEAASQTAINRMLVELAHDADTVVRLKGGDPFVFGRGSEELAALVAEGIEVVVVPGVSSAFAVPAAAGIPVTHRGVARGVLVITGHEVDDGDFDWALAADRAITLVVLMGMARRDGLSKRLTAAGRPASTPAAIIQWGTTDREQVHVTTLGALGDAELGSPGTIVIGDVVALRHGSLTPQGRSALTDVR